jgi:hypothetical protein
MPKKITDISNEKKNAKINLRQRIGNIPEKEKKRLKKGGEIYKEDFTKIKDLGGGAEPEFVYVKAKNYAPPKRLFGLLKIAGIGIIIIVIINLLNIYFSGIALQKEVEKTAMQGYENLVAGGKDTTKIEFGKAVTAFDEALGNFSAAKDKLWFVNSDQSFYSEDIKSAQSVNNLLEGGKNFALAGGLFLEAMDEFNKIPILFFSRNEEEAQKPVESDKSITETLKTGLKKVSQAIEKINTAAENFNNVNQQYFPDNIALRIELAKKQITDLNDILNSISKHFPAILKLLGSEHPHRYLILMQNNNELRPTGGFIGSYAIVDVNDGYLDKVEVQDVYDIDGSYTGLITPPEELVGFTDNWRFRDSNYHPDFPTSAEKAAWMLEKEGGPTVDTVIAINQGLLKGLLEVTGPVQVGDFGELSADNYNLLLSYIIEGKVWGEEDPKHILKVFIPAFKDAIFKTRNAGKLSSKLIRAVQQKHIMAYSKDADVQALFEAVGMGGDMHANTEGEDYLRVIHTSVGGTKSDQFIEETINHNTYITQDGEITDEVKIIRKHTWTDDIYYSWRKVLQKYGFSDMPDQLIDNLGRGRNKSSVRIYVPLNSELLDSSKQVSTKYDKVTNLTYFMTDIEVTAGQTTDLTIKYKLPFKIDFEPAGQYKLVVEKQSGSVGSIFTKTLNMDGNVKELSVYPEEVRAEGENGLVYATNLVYDRYFSALLSR